MSDGGSWYRLCLDATRRQADAETMTINIDTARIGLLAGKVIFITGASRGIGAAAARLFAREGADVVLAARSTDALDRIVTEIRADGGVAIQRQPGPLDTTSEEDIDEQFAVNFRAHWSAMTAEAALMRRAGGGAIVNTSSIGSRRANPDLPAYGAHEARSTASPRPPP